MKSTNSLINVEDGSDTERGGELGVVGTREKITITEGREEVGRWREDGGGRKEELGEKRIVEEGRREDARKMEGMGGGMMNSGIGKMDGGEMRVDRVGRMEERGKRVEGGRMEEGGRMDEARGRREEAGGRRDEGGRRESPLVVRTVKTQQADKFGYLKKFLKSENPRKEDGNSNLALSLDEGQKVMEFTNALDFKKQVRILT